MSALPSSISSLSVDEKRDLLDALWLDLEANGSSPTGAQDEELDRRVAAYEAQPGKVVAWDDVRARLRQQ